jgi:hypothetical protein
VLGKEEARVHIGQGCGQEGFFAKSVVPMTEAMCKFVELSLTATSHNEDCSNFLKNLQDGDRFAMDVVTRGGSAAKPVKIHTLPPVLELFLTHAPFAFSLQYAMAIILKRSQDEMLSAPA